MTTNGNIKPNGHNGNGKWGDVGKELGGFTVAEFVAEGTWLGVAAVAAMLPEKIMSGASKAIGHTLVEPVLEPLEKLMGRVCKLEECKIDPEQPREKRAENLARALIIFIPAVALSWEIKIRTRRWMNKKTGVKIGEVQKHEELPANASIWNKVAHHTPFLNWSPQERMIFLADEGMQLGSMYVLNNQLASVTDDMIRTTTGLTQKITGASEQKAHDFATAACIWVVPNMIGGIGAAAAIAGKNLREWPTGLIGKLLGKKDAPSHG